MFRNYSRHIFGLPMPYLQDCAYTGVLSQGEDLFISAHGSPEGIGHPGGVPRFTARELARWLENWVFPCNYWGNLYLAAPGANPDYLEALLDSLGPAYADRINGQFDLAYSQLRPPVESEWVRVA